MSDESPLFVSSLELIAHATELFAQKNPKKYKFVILHLANAIELVLKDHLIDMGLSIYEPKTNRTIGIWECINKLNKQGAAIPELPIIELLIDDRNTIQHRFGYPTAETAYYYIKQVVSFFQRFLQQHYNIELLEALKPHLSPDNLQLLGLVKDELHYLELLANVSIESSVLAAFNIVERELEKYLVPFSESLSPRSSREKLYKYLPMLLEDLKQKGYLVRDMQKDYEVLRNARNYAAHSPVGATSKIDWQKALNIAKELIAGLQKASNAGYTFVPEVEIEVSDK